MAVIVITGSTRGLGRGLASAFIERGHSVMIAGRKAEEIASTVAELRADGGTADGIACDVSQIDQVEVLARTAEDTLGPIDIWINNAGLARNTRPILDCEQSDIEAMVHTNMIGQMNGSRTAARLMSARGHGKIINILGGGSDGEYFPGMGVYGATKRGLDYFTDALTKELAGAGVFVAKVRPGLVVTDAVIREARDNPDMFEKSRSMMNNIVDQVETVAPWIADQVLALDKTGRKIRWLTGSRIGWRMLAGRFRRREDQFARFGL